MPETTPTTGFDPHAEWAKVLDAHPDARIWDEHDLVVVPS